MIQSLIFINVIAGRWSQSSSENVIFQSQRTIQWCCLKEHSLLLRWNTTIRTNQNSLKQHKKLYFCHWVPSWQMKLCSHKVWGFKLKYWGYATYPGRRKKLSSMSRWKVLRVDFWDVKHPLRCMTTTCQNKTKKDRHHDKPKARNCTACGQQSCCWA